MNNPFGPSRRARAVQHEARGVAADARLGRCVLGSRPRVGRRAKPAQLRQLGSQRLDDWVLLVAGDDRPRAAVREEITQLLSGEPGVQGERNRPRVQRSQVGRQER